MSESALKQESAAPDESLQWVTFQVADEIYGVNVLQVQEVLKFAEITPVPGAPSFVLGIINLRGNVVTVIDMRTRFGLPSKEADDVTRIIFAETHGHIIGMLVDSVTDVINLRPSQIEMPPGVRKEENNSSHYVEGVYSTDERILTLIDVEKLFNDEELSEEAGF